MNGISISRKNRTSAVGAETNEHQREFFKDCLCFLVGKMARKMVRITKGMS